MEADQEHEEEQAEVTDGEEDGKSGRRKDPGGEVRRQAAEERGAEQESGRDLADDSRLSDPGRQRTDEAGDGDDDDELNQEPLGVEHARRLPRLLAAEARLDRSFSACVTLAVIALVWPVYLRWTGQAGVGWMTPVPVALLAAFLIAYFWFSVTVASAVHGLGGRRGGYVAWLVAAPVLWVLLPVPILSTIILASPLSLKWVLSRQLRSEIHDLTFAR
jgi:hypothetical protein